MKSKLDLSSPKVRAAFALVAVIYGALVLTIGAPRAMASWAPFPIENPPTDGPPTWHLILTPFGWLPIMW